MDWSEFADKQAGISTALQGCNHERSTFAAVGHGRLAGYRWLGLRPTTHLQSAAAWRSGNCHAGQVGGFAASRGGPDRRNFDLIRKGADELASICQSNIWRPREDQVYSHYRGELQRAAIKLADLAEQQNLDGAAYTYMHALTTCINCHQYSRDVLRVATLPPGTGAVVSIPVTDQPLEAPRRTLLR